MVHDVVPLLKPLLLIAAVQADPATLGTVDVGPVDDVIAGHDVDVTLRGSPGSMARQHAIAVASDLSFTGTLDEMETLADHGDLVPIGGGRHYAVMDWVFPYGIPEVRTFVERLAAEYRGACGEEMVVTSLTRPYSEQLPNSHQLSVHPAGMAVDLRIPRNPDCRAFLEEDLLAKEEDGLVDITRERAPPHYHVAVFPEPFEEWEETQPELPGVTAQAEPGEAQRDTVPPEAAPAVGLWWLLFAAILVVVALAGIWRYLRRRQG